jgi:hypothetical protein
MLWIDGNSEPKKHRGEEVLVNSVDMNAGLSELQGFGEWPDS